MVQDEWGRHDVKCSSGKFVLSRNVWYKTSGVVMMLNIVLNPGKPTPKSNFRTGPSASCGYRCPLCPTGDWYPGKIRFIEP